MVLGATPVWIPGRSLCIEPALFSACLFLFLLHVGVAVVWFAETKSELDFLEAPPPYNPHMAATNVSNPNYGAGAGAGVRYVGVASYARE